MAFNLKAAITTRLISGTPEKKDFGPRLAIAFAPAPSDGFWKMLFGNQKSSIRAGYSLVFDHFGAATVNTFDTTGSYGLSSHLSNAPGSVPIEDRTTIHDHQRRAAIVVAIGSSGRISLRYQRRVETAALPSAGGWTLQSRHPTRT